MARLRVNTNEEWWLVYGDPSDNPAEDTRFLIRGLTQKQLAEIGEKATKSKWIKNPKGEWVPKDNVNLSHFADQLAPYIAGWERLDNLADGGPLPYSAEMVEKVLNYPGVLGGLLYSINLLAKTNAAIVEAQLGN